MRDRLPLELVKAHLSCSLIRILSFMMVKWFNKSINIFLNEPDVGAIGIDTPVKLPDWRMK